MKRYRIGVVGGDTLTSQAFGGLLGRQTAGNLPGVTSCTRIRTVDGTSAVSTGALLWGCCTGQGGVQEAPGQHSRRGPGKTTCPSRLHRTPGTCSGHQVEARTIAIIPAFTTWGSMNETITHASFSDEPVSA